MVTKNIKGEMELQNAKERLFKAEGEIEALETKLREYGDIYSSDRGQTKEEQQRMTSSDIQKVMKKMN